MWPDIPLLPAEHPFLNILAIESGAVPAEVYRNVEERGHPDRIQEYLRLHIESLL